ncbi:MAG: T9SS type A sorting domain-containing protein [Bacteroidota bacterium]
MKKIYTLFIVICVAIGLNAQSCLPGGIIFETQAQIDNFQNNYPNCTEIEGTVEISGDDITNLNGLSVLITIEGWLYVMDNNSLISLTGLDNLTFIGGGLYIQGHEALTNLSGLGGLTSIGQEFAIFYNASLISLVGLDKLTSVGAGLYIEGNTSLYSLAGLEHMTSIGEDFTVNSNPSLTNLTGLTNLTSIGGWFGIEENAALTSLTGLDSIDASSIINLYIAYNESLSTCEVQSVCDYLADPIGTIEIHDNNTGCNTSAEVENACENASVNESSYNRSFFIYPNPSSTQITIEMPTTPHKNIFMAIYNMNGQQLLITQQIKEQQTVVDISLFPKGVYFVKVMDDKKVMVQKVVKR